MAEICKVSRASYFFFRIEEQVGSDPGFAHTEPSSVILRVDKELQELHEYYGTACAEIHPEYYQAISFGNRELIEMMVDFSGRTSKDDLYAPVLNDPLTLPRFVSRVSVPAPGLPRLCLATLVRTSPSHAAAQYPTVLRP